MLQQRQQMMQFQPQQPPASHGKDWRMNRSSFHEYHTEQMELFYTEYRDLQVNNKW